MASRTQRMLTLILLLLLLSILIINVYSLSSYPAPHCDEAGSGVLGYSLVTQGYPSFLFMADYSQVSNALVGRFYHWLVGQALMVSQPRLITARIVSLAGLLTSLLLAALTGRRLWGSWFGGTLAAVILASSLNMFWASHIARPEIWVIAFALATILMFLEWRQSTRPGLVLLMGIWLPVSGALNHPNGVFFSAAIGVMVLARLVEKKASLSQWLLLLGGIGAGGLMVLALHALTSPDNPFAMIAATTAHHCGSPFCLPDLSDATRLGQSLVGHRLATTAGFLWQGYILNFNHAVIPYTIYALAGIVLFLVNVVEEHRWILTYVAVAFALFVFGTPYKSPFYAALWDAGLALIISGAVIAASRKLAGRVLIVTWPDPDLAALLLALPLVVVQILGSAWLAFKFAPRDFEAYSNKIMAMIEPGSHVLGNTTFWYPLHESYTFTGDWYLVSLPSITVYDAPIVDQTVDVIRKLDIDYIIDTGTLGCSGEPTPLYEAYRAQFLEVCQPVGSVEDRWLGAYGQLGRAGATTVYACQQSD